LKIALNRSGSTQLSLQYYVLGWQLLRCGNPTPLPFYNGRRSMCWINRPVEAREHVRRFHELFFTLAPDKSAIESNMKRAFDLADKSAFDYYRDLSEKGYYNRIISGNVQQRVEVDSVICDFNSYPYSVTTYARQFIIRSSNLTRRSLVTSCNLLNSVRSDSNPQGFQILKFSVLSNKDEEIVER